MREVIPAATQKRSGSELALIVVFSAAALLVHVPTNGRYGYFRDELYYIACGRHLALGYVDQPPLSILLLRLSQALLGDSLFAFIYLSSLSTVGRQLFGFGSARCWDSVSKTNIPRRFSPLVFSLRFCSRLSAVISQENGSGLEAWSPLLSRCQTFFGKHSITGPLT